MMKHMGGIGRNDYTFSAFIEGSEVVIEIAMPGRPSIIDRVKPIDARQIANIILTAANAAEVVEALQ